MVVILLKPCSLCYDVRCLHGGLRVGGNIVNFFVDPLNEKRI